MRFLLLQARNPGDAAEAQEQASFREVIGQGDEAIRPWNLLHGPPAASDLAGVDCLLVGGAGEYGVGDAAENPWIGEFIEYLGDAANQGIPIFASCLGFQALVVALGGRVETDKSRAEVGTFELSVTDHGREDPLFSSLYPSFGAQLGHKDHAIELPPGVVHLASSARSRYQALKIPGKPIYATQFHPELNMGANRRRFITYLKDYSSPDMVDQPEEILAAFRETEGATGTLRRYVDEILPGYV